MGGESSVIEIAYFESRSHPAAGGGQKASADVVYGCVNSKSGEIKIVSATTNCPGPSNGGIWTKISWNVTSPQDPPGPTNLLFPFVTNAGGFDTAITISNTSADPFNTATQTETCKLSIYSAAIMTPPLTFTTPTIAPGTTFTGLISTIANTVVGGLSGYMFAACTFTYAHGFAFVSDLGAKNLAAGYLALVVQTPRPNGENLNN
jgi:hypothetical protein